LWLLVREQVGATAAATQDQRRLQAAIAARRTKSVEFFTSSSGQWDRLREEMFGDRFHLAALAAFADPDATVGDLGCGTGQVSAALAPFVAHVVAVDASAAMLQAARKRLHDVRNVELRRGDLESLPIDDSRLDAATVMLVLHHVPEPGRALADVARVLKPGGRLVLVDMLPHDRESYRQQMGHVWLGFSEDHVLDMLGDAGFERARVVPLPPDPKATGPALFVASGVKAQPTSDKGE
jgi:ArsR family transcriptional regulator